jgi:hypothetical protein
MVLLALAMFAVSSTTRSTTVQSARTSHNSAVRSVGGANRMAPVMQRSSVARRAAAKSHEPLPLLASSETMYSTLCGLETATPSALQTVRVVPVVQAVIEPRSDSVCDCLSHYDPSYDCAVYGVSPATMQSSSKTDAGVLEDVSSPADLDSLFQDLLSGRSLPARRTGA